MGGDTLLLPCSAAGGAASDQLRPAPACVKQECTAGLPSLPPTTQPACRIAFQACPLKHPLVLRPPSTALLHPPPRAQPPPPSQPPPTAHHSTNHQLKEKVRELWDKAKKGLKKIPDHLRQLFDLPKKTKTPKVPKTPKPAAAPRSSKSKGRRGHDCATPPPASPAPELLEVTTAPPTPTIAPEPVTAADQVEQAATPKTQAAALPLPDSAAALDDCAATDEPAAPGTAGCEVMRAFAAARAGGTRPRTAAPRTLPPRPRRLWEGDNRSVVGA